MKPTLGYFAVTFKQQRQQHDLGKLIADFLMPSFLATLVLAVIDSTPRGSLVQFLLAECVFVLTIPLWVTSLMTVRYICQRIWYDTVKRTPGYLCFRVSYRKRIVAETYWDGVFDKNERIIGSAILDNENTAWVVLAPGRHHHCRWYMADKGHQNEDKSQGFYTNRGRYLNRKTALILARVNGQCLEPYAPPRLFSEDIWDTPDYLREGGPLEK